MTLADMASLISGRLGQRTDLDTMIYAEIRQAQRTLEKTPPYPWFLLTANTEDYSAQYNALPDNFIEMAEDVLYITKATDDTNAYSEPVRIYGGYNEHIFTDGTDVTGRPVNWDLYLNYIRLFPTPDVSYRIHYLYYATENSLGSGVATNQWSTKAEDVLIAEAGWHVARNIRDPQATQEFALDKQDAMRRMRQESTSRLESMRRAQIGAGEDALL